MTGPALRSRGFIAPTEARIGIAFIDNGHGYNVYEDREQIGTVSRLGHGWRAVLPEGTVFPVSFTSRKKAADRLAKTAESRSAA